MRSYAVNEEHTHWMAVLQFSIGVSLAEYIQTPPPHLRKLYRHYRLREMQLLWTWNCVVENRRRQLHLLLFIIWTFLFARRYGYTVDANPLAQSMPASKILCSVYLNIMLNSVYPDDCHCHLVDLNGHLDIFQAQKSRYIWYGLLKYQGCQIAEITYWRVLGKKVICLRYVVK